MIRYPKSLEALVPRITNWTHPYEGRMAMGKDVNSI